MKKILYIDGCVNRDSSRTEFLAQRYLQNRIAQGDCQIQSLILENTPMLPLTEKLLVQREQFIRSGDFSDPVFDLAHMFKAADEVVFAAPYWDMSFPAIVKVYLEQICINNLTFYYNDQGFPCGLTNVKSVVYITTSGGYIGNCNHGFDYTKNLFSNLFSVNNFQLFSAEGLDICTNDPRSIMDEAVKKLDAHFSKRSS